MIIARQRVTGVAVALSLAASTLLGAQADRATTTGATGAPAQPDASTSATLRWAYDSDALARLALEAGLRDFNAKHGGKARVNIRLDAAGDSTTSAPVMRFDAESPDGKERRSWRFDAATGTPLD